MLKYPMPIIWNVNLLEISCDPGIYVLVLLFLWNSHDARQKSGTTHATTCMLMKKLTQHIVKENQTELMYVLLETIKMRTTKRHAV